MQCCVQMSPAWILSIFLKSEKRILDPLLRHCRLNWSALHNSGKDWNSHYWRTRTPEPLPPEMNQRGYEDLDGHVVLGVRVKAVWHAATSSWLGTGSVPHYYREESLTGLNKDDIIDKMAESSVLLQHLFISGAGNYSQVTLKQLEQKNICFGVRTFLDWHFCCCCKWTFVFDCCSEHSK